MKGENVTPLTTIRKEHRESKGAWYSQRQDRICLSEPEGELTR